MATLRALGGLEARLENSVCIVLERLSRSRTGVR